MFDAYSPPLVDSTFTPLRAGINPLRAKLKFRRVFNHFVRINPVPTGEALPEK